jgi:ADP-ribose pyrophosphatase
MPPGTEAPRTPAPIGAGLFDFFFYGTLCDPDVRKAVIGRPCEALPASLENYEAVPAEHGRFPILQFKRGTTASGVLCPGIMLIEAARLSFFEDEAADYDARALTVRVSPGAFGEATPRERRAWVFLPTKALRRGMGRWDLAEWQRFAKRTFLNAAMRAMRKVEAKDIEPFVDLWRARASIT